MKWWLKESAEEDLAPREETLFKRDETRMQSEILDVAKR